MNFLSESDLFYVIVIRKDSFGFETFVQVKNGTSALYKVTVDVPYFREQNKHQIEVFQKPRASSEQFKSGLS